LNRDTLFQASTIEALLNGVFDGEVQIGTLRKHGDIGIGTFNALDGEMIALDGKFYQIGGNGMVLPANDLEKTPFAAVTFFDVDKKAKIRNIADIEHLKETINGMLPSANIFYAIRIEGTFKYIKTRSVPEQQEPYPPILEIIKKQPVFEFNDVEGTIVGFWCPEYVKDINVPGFHFHFIDKKRSAGGHLLGCEIETADVEIDDTTRFRMILSNNKEFLNADLTREKDSDLGMVEKDQKTGKK